MQNVNPKKRDKNFHLCLLQKIESVQQVEKQQNIAAFDSTI